MRICTLASSSSGNCILVYSKNTKLLVDIGINLEEVLMRLKALEIEPSEITAILLTHEHGDHTRSVGAFMRKFSTPLYVHKNTEQHALKRLGKIDAESVITFYDQPFQLGEFNIKSFSLPHDASYCVGFNIEKDDKKISIATDLGHTNDDIVKNLQGSRLVVLESNHDEKMLLNNDNYSAVLKSRILGPHGHLSNAMASVVVEQLAKSGVKHVMLAHLSKENNTPQVAFDTICNHLKSVGIEPNKNIYIDVAPADKISTVYHLK